MATDLTQEFVEGQKAPNAPSPYLWSSDVWCGFTAGQKMAGTPGVKRVWKPRGFTVKVQTHDGAVTTIQFGGRELDAVKITRA